MIRLRESDIGRSVTCEYKAHCRGMQPVRPKFYTVRQGAVQRRGVRNKRLGPSVVGRTFTGCYCGNVITVR